MEDKRPRVGAYEHVSTVRAVHDRERRGQVDETVAGRVG